MPANTPVRDPALLSDAAEAPPALRVGIVSDYLEEQWPSMDLVGDMLTRFVQQQPASRIAATQLRPAMRRRFSGLPGIGHSRSLRNVDRLVSRLVDYPRWLRKRAAAFDLFHLVDHSYSQLLHVLPQGRAVVTCHDLDTFRCLLEPEREPRSRVFRAMTARILDGFLQAAHVIAVSRSTRDELLRHRLFPAERITVIPNGVHPSCSLVQDQEADAQALGWMPEHDPESGGRLFWLLNVGNLMERKRLDVLLRVFASVHACHPQARLMRVGGFAPAHAELIRKLNIEAAVTSLSFLDRRALSAVYRRSGLLVHTADAEGFGLPLVEAMACGCPVAASDIPVLREVGGEAAAFAPVADIDAWRHAILALIEEQRQQPDAWERRRQRSVAWAARFSWTENARRTAELYRQVFEASNA